MCVTIPSRWRLVLVRWEGLREPTRGVYCTPFSKPRLRGWRGRDARLRRHSALDSRAPNGGSWRCIAPSQRSRAAKKALGLVHSRSQTNSSFRVRRNRSERDRERMRAWGPGGGCSAQSHKLFAQSNRTIRATPRMATTIRRTGCRVPHHSPRTCPCDISGRLGGCGRNAVVQLIQTTGELEGQHGILEGVVIWSGSILETEVRCCLRQGQVARHFLIIQSALEDVSLYSMLCFDVEASAPALLNSSKRNALS